MTPHSTDGVDGCGRPFNPRDPGSTPRGRTENGERVTRESHTRQRSGLSFPPSWASGWAMQSA